MKTRPFACVETGPDRHVAIRTGDVVRGFARSGGASVLVRIICLGALAVSLGACTIFGNRTNIETALTPGPDDRPRVSFDSVRSRDPQAGIGAKGHPRILAANGGAYSNPELEKMLALIAGALVARTNEPDRVYDITVLDSADVNAFALPGGYLYITRGLLALANDSAEIAAVLAHEMAHVSANHGVRRSEAAKAVDIAQQVVSEIVSNPLAGEVAKASTKQKLAAFSQRQELQADAVGIKQMDAAGYDPFGAPRFLASMDRYAAWRSALAAPTSEMASSHPSTPQRVDLAARHARALGPPGRGKKARERFLAGIDGLTFGENASEGFVRGNRFSHAGLGITFTVPDGFELNNRRDAVLAAGPDQQALRFDAVNRKGTPPDPADYLRSGWVNGLLEDTVRTTTINGMNAATAQALAGDWQFSIAVVDHKSRHFRFILAAPRSSAGVETAARAILKSFKPLTKAQIADLKPLRIRLATVKQGDTVATLVGRMQGVKRPELLFRALNGLGPKDGVKAGDVVKLVREG